MLVATVYKSSHCKWKLSKLSWKCQKPWSCQKDCKNQNAMKLNSNFMIFPETVMLPETVYKALCKWQLSKFLSKCHKPCTKHFATENYLNFHQSAINRVQSTSQLKVTLIFIKVPETVYKALCKWKFTNCHQKARNPVQSTESEIDFHDFSRNRDFTSNRDFARNREFARNPDVARNQVQTTLQVKLTRNFMNYP